VAELVGRLRIGELAERSGVSVATIKYYIREGLLPPPPVKTGKTMAFYDEAYLERLLLVKRLREEHFPVRVIKEIVADQRELAPSEAALLSRVAPAVLARLDPGGDGEALTRTDVMARFAIGSEELAVLEEIGLVGEGGRFGRADLELLTAFQAAERAGLSRDRFPVEGVGHYVELLGELARREVKVFVHSMKGVGDAEIEALAERALAITAPIVEQIRRKLILRLLKEGKS
jgi:DNA-binding transcriptional MerR regulator